MTNQNDQTCIEHGTILDSYFVAAEPHPNGGIVPAHEELSCSDCILETLSFDELIVIEPSSGLASDLWGGYLRYQDYLVDTYRDFVDTDTWAFYLVMEKPAPKFKQYAEGVIGSRFVSSKTRRMGYAVNVLDHHILADHYGSLPIVRESEIEDLLTDPESVEDVIEFGFIADDWAEIETLRNKEISKEAGLKFDTNK
jgi:hypothetical protein